MEKGINLIESEAALSYKIRDKDGKVVEFRNCDSVEDLAEYFQNDYEMLGSGVYKLLVGHSMRFKESTAKNVTFRIAGEQSAALPVATQRTKNMSTQVFTIEDLERARNEGKQEGIKEAHYMMLEKEVKMLRDEVKGLKDNVKTLANWIDEQDGEKDGNILTQAGSLIGEVSDLKESLSTFSFGGK